MRNVILALFGMILLCGCDDNDSAPENFHWKKLGLEGKIVNEIQVQGNKLFVGTTSGLYLKDYTLDEDFELLGFENLKVENFVVLNENLIFASVVGNDVEDVGKLFKSENGGQSWEEVENDFGGEYPETINYLAAVPGNTSVLYASGAQVIAKSENAGVNWEPIWGEWGGFGTGVDVIKVNPNDVNEIWAGGQGGIENGFLLRSENGGGDWTSWHDLVENPTVVKEIVFNEDGDKVYVGFEGALLMSKNGGSTWQTLIDSKEDNRFFFGIGKSSENPDLLFSAGWLKRFDDPQPLILFVSTDDGQTWNQREYEAVAFGGVYDLKVISEQNQERIFAGLYKGGVYEILIDRNF